MIGKQKKLIIIFTAIIAVMVVGYFVVVVPLVNQEEPVETTAPIETQAGEQLGTSDRYLMFPHIEKKGMQAIDVYNEFGHYQFYRDENDAFQIEGFAGVPYNPELFSQLVVDCGYTLAKVKVVDNATDDELAEYGLDEASNPAKFVLTTLEGAEHTVYVGHPIISGGGYYCMYEGRRSVYVLGTTLGTTVLAKIEDFVTPVLTYIPTDNANEYIFIEAFMLFRGEEEYPFIAARTRNEDERFNEDAMVEHIVTYPNIYTPSDTTYYEVLQKMSALQGDFTAKLGVTDEAIEQYGLENPAYTIYFKYQDLEYTVFISELQDDGYYYAVSPLFDIIAGVSQETFNFLNWELVKWLQPTIFQVNINYVESISVTSPNTDEIFYLEGEGQDLIVHVGSPDGEITDTANFRQFYKVLLSVVIENYVPFTEEETDAILTDTNMQLEFRIKMRNGTEYEYQFYPYSTRRSVVSINGKREFYTYRDSIQKVENDTKRVLNNEPIESYGKN